MNTAFRYRVNKKIQELATRPIRFVVKSAEEAIPDLQGDTIKKILLVRASFRLGSSILATPGIFLFRENFPHARIDFVGGPIAEVLFRNLPIDNCFQITRHPLRASWAYFALLWEIRSVGYDLAMDLSGSQSAMGSLIVELSRSRFRIGMRGKRDRWYNVRLSRPNRNKYEVLPALVRSMGLRAGEIFPSIVLSFAEREEGFRKMAALLGDNYPYTVGVFVGARQKKGKSWPKANFLDLITQLHLGGMKVVVFAGPEETDLIQFFTYELNGRVPVVYERSLRLFAAMVASCALFVACDSGPMHLACALGVRTVAIFQEVNLKRWGPPSKLGRIVCQSACVSPSQVFRACLEELQD